MGGQPFKDVNHEPNVAGSSRAELVFTGNQSVKEHSCDGISVVAIM